MLFQKKHKLEAPTADEADLERAFGPRDQSLF